MDPTGVLVAVGIMGGLGVLLGLLLGVAARYLHVPEDPRLATVEEMLPGSNCGACGEPGCHAFAEALLAGAHAPGDCTVSEPERVERLADFLGVDAGGGERLVARLHCAGGREEALQIAYYEGFPSCRAAAVVAGGGKGCAWGCLGLADCERACTFDAIAMNEDGLPVVDEDLCTACGDCVEACPRDLFELLPRSQPLVVRCKIPLTGEEARALCRVACDGCGRCAQDAPEGLVRMEGGLAVVDYTRHVEGAEVATRRCPTGAIQWLAPARTAAEEARA